MVSCIGYEEIAAVINHNVKGNVEGGFNGRSTITAEAGLPTACHGSDLSGLGINSADTTAALLHNIRGYLPNRELSQQGSINWLEWPERCRNGNQTPGYQPR